MTAAREAPVLAPAGSVCRPFGIGFSGSMRWVQPDWWTARRPVRLRDLIRRNAGADRRRRATNAGLKLHFGAICPERGGGAGLVLPWCNSATMALHLDEISQTVSPGAHAVVLLDQAGWHTSAKLSVRPEALRVI